MHRLYSISSPTESAAKPARWSFSSLIQWRTCPRRWWLLHSKYAGRPYPTPLAPSALRGQLVHQALEAYSIQLERSPQLPFDARKFIRKQLDDSLSVLTDQNPRVNTSILRARFSLDEAVAYFWRIAEHFTPAAAANAGSLSLEVSSVQDGEDWPSGPEVWIDLDDPPLCGRIDLVENRRLIEFKTSEEDEQHESQLRFYALLWWLRTGHLPEQLTLAYVHTDKWVNIAVPSLSEIRGLREEYRLLTTAANVAIDQESPEAHASEETCHYCPVRQLCGDYWQSSNTLALRNPSAEAETVFADIRLTNLPTTWTGNGALSGTATAELFGEVSVFIGAHKGPVPGLPKPEAAVLLGARAQREGERWKITLPPAAEVFWMIPS